MSDDGVDWAGFARDSRSMDAETCIAIRQRLAGTGTQIVDLAESERFGGFSRSVIGRHARGDCPHEHDTPPVKRVVRWQHEFDHDA